MAFLLHCLEGTLQIAEDDRNLDQPTRKKILQKQLRLWRIATVQIQMFKLLFYVIGWKSKILLIKIGDPNIQKSDKNWVQNSGKINWSKW